MNKKQRDYLGISQILELIEPGSRYLDAVKRGHLIAPLANCDLVNESYRKVADLMHFLAQERGQRLQALLEQIMPFELPSKSSFRLSLADLFELKSFIFHYQALRDYLLQHLPEQYQFQDLSEVFQLLDPEKARLPVFRLSPLFSAKLRELDTQRQKEVRRLKVLRHQLLEDAKRELDLPRLKEEFCLSRSESELIAQIEGSGYFGQSMQSIANITFSLRDSSDSNLVKAEIARLNKEIEREEESVLEALSQSVQEKSIQISMAQKQLKGFAWDFLRADFGIKYHCCIPKITGENSHKIDLKAAQNLPLAQSLKKQGRQYQSLDLVFEKRASLILGPNMGGKSTILKCLAQIAELARYAIPIAASEAELPYFDFVYFNHETEAENLSSFGAEVVAFSRALQKKGRGFFLLDEFARGTNPQEGELLAAAVIRYLAEGSHSLVAATHFNLPAKIPQIPHYRIKGIAPGIYADLPANSSLEQRLQALAESMDYSLQKTGEKAVPQDAVHVAKALGLPKEILRIIEALRQRGS